MDTRRLILFMAFTMSVFFLVDAWHRDQQPPKPPSAGSVPANGPTGTPVPAPTQPLSAPPPATAGAMQKGETVRVDTDLMSVDIDTAGGDLRRLELLTHRDTLDKKKT